MNAIATTSTQTPAVRQATLRDMITGESMKRQFALALPKALPLDRFVRCLVTTLNRDPKLLECDRNSVLAGAMTAAQLGLEIDPALGRAYLLPYKGKAQLIIGYKGYVDLAYRSGQLAGLQAEAVYAADHFSYALGLDPKLEHVPADCEDRGDLKYAYAVANLSNGGKAWRVLNRAQVMKHKKSSQSASSSYSPWVTHEEEMWRKTAIRALASILPLSPELRDAVATDDSDRANDVAYANALVVTPSDDIAPVTHPQPGDKAEQSGETKP
jgi:recombination protein RecT